MSVTIIKTKDRKPYRPAYLAFMSKYFAEEFEVAIPAWTESPFYFCNVSLNEDQSVSGCSILLLTTEKTFQEILAGKVKEHEIRPLEPGQYGMPYLYWSTLIVENRQHAPYLIKSIFSEIAECVAKWELMITHVYSIAFTKVSERLMRRYFFEQAGTYTQHGHVYPVMVSKVADNPYFRAFIPK